jgi:hypothetical protein
VAARRVALLSLVVGALAAVGGAVAATGTPGTITTVAGTGLTGQTGDGGPASAAEISHPRGIAFAPGGGYVFADAFANTVRRVWPDGHISTIAGTGTAGFSGDDGPAAAAELDLPHGVAFTTGTTLLVADALNNRIRAIDAGGTITTVAGTGVPGFAGDGGPAASAQIDAPRGIASLPRGGFLIPDSGNQRIRVVAADGTITTVAGDGTRGFAGDGGPATQAELSLPFAVAPTADGGLLIADTGNDRIRRVAPDGTITTVAGDGIRGYGGDGGPATQAALNSPHNLAVLPDGGFLIADEGNNRVRRVWPNGTITTVVGTGESGFSGDGGPPAAAELNQPKAIAVLPDYQGFLLADAANSRVRLVAVDLRRILLLRPKTRTLRARLGRAAALVLTVDDAVTLRLRVRNGTRTVLAFASKARAGANTIRFGAGLKAGTYRVTVTASSLRDRPATTTLILVVDPAGKR